MIAPHCRYIPPPAAMMKHRLILAIAVALAATALAVCSAAAQAACDLNAAGSGKVAAVRDGRTLMLDDGRELRLAAIEVAGASHDALQTLAAGRVLRL
jgi:hypothetical protein